MSIKVVDQSNLDFFLLDSGEVKRRIFIAGASGSGKSTLWRLLRSRLSGNIDFPVRLISRGNRKDDDLSENQHLPIEEFESLFYKKSIEFFWPKFLPECTEYYGFEFSKSETAVYGCNNEFLLNAIHLKSHSNLLEKSVVIYVTCDAEIRKARLIERYSTQSAPSKEINYRIESDKRETDLIKKCHIILQNNSTELLRTMNDLINLLALSEVGSGDIKWDGA